MGTSRDRTQYLWRSCMIFLHINVLLHACLFRWENTMTLLTWQENPPLRPFSKSRFWLTWASCSFWYANVCTSLPLSKNISNAFMLRISIYIDENGVFNHQISQVETGGIMSAVVSFSEDFLETQVFFVPSANAVKGQKFQKCCVVISQ